MTAHRPPRRQGKEDRLRHPVVTQAELRCDLICASVTRAWEAADDEWGFETLLGLLPPAWASRYGALTHDLQTAHDARDEAACRLAAEALIRAIGIMREKAREFGHTPTVPEVWWAEADDGTRIGFVRHADQQTRAMRAHPGATICTAREALVALKPALFGLLSETKRLFPGAEMTAIRKRSETEEFLEDEIPW